MAKDLLRPSLEWQKIYGDPVMENNVKLRQQNSDPLRWGMYHVKLDYLNF